MTAAGSAVVDYFRCPERFGAIRVARELSGTAGYFRFDDVVCFGRVEGTAPTVNADADGAMPRVEAHDCDGTVALPFDLAEVVTNLRQERYTRTPPRLERLADDNGLRALYYAVRPLLPVGVRRHLQRVQLSGWERIPFPRWPVDTTVESLMQRTMAAILETEGCSRIPFVWFWPRGASAAAMVTHDVEGPSGRAFSSRLMDIDDAFGIRSAFQIIPEISDGDSHGQLEELTRRGFEVNLHDLNHDGHLFRDRATFLERVAEINRYARTFGCRGFRSGAMYREQEWFDAFDFSFDMSVPNVAHLEPQRGGCCTVMPYFVGRVLELPLTLAQDYSLFNILGDYSTALWRRQIDLIRQSNGLISVIAHPDYLLEPRAQPVYRELLAHLCELRDGAGVWIATPGEIDTWWRRRSRMTVEQIGEEWRICGDDEGDARVAFAVKRNGSGCISYEVQP